jgi:DNA mismatch repair protein MutL
MPIRVLDPAIVGRIAAGEVVERPASAAKELIENAIDAGASSVTLEIKDGGIALLRVTDNGSGIAPGQVALAFENHATSKIASATELDDIRTLGFRGEALPSIASVAHVEMTTRERGAHSGVRLRIDGGERHPIEEVGCPEGTTVVVSELFYNIPVRRAFLKKPAYEGSLVNDLAARMILGNPSVSFRFVSNGKAIYHSFGDGNLKHAVFAVYGSETAEKMSPVDSAFGGMRIWGMIGVGELSKPTRAHQFFYINGRSVHCALMTQVLVQVCAGRVTIGTYPMCALMLQIPPASVDVNVHPNKLEVRFRDEQSIRQSAEYILAQAFAGETMLGPSRDDRTFGHAYVVEERQTAVDHPQTEVEEKQAEVENKQAEVELEQTEVTGSLRPMPRRGGIPTEPRDFSKLELREYDAPAPEPPAQIRLSPREACEESRQIVIPERIEPERAKPAEPAYRVIGTLLKTYILIELGDALILIDQHAAHERILYERFNRRLESGGTASQPLLVPAVIDVTQREMTLLTDFDESLRAAGYEVEPFGERSISVRAVPFILGRADVRPVFMEMLESLDRIATATKEARRDELAMMACKAAVKGGDSLTGSEISSLIDIMQKTGAPPTCPHGRPVFRTLTRREIEKMFRRIQ